MFRLQKSFSSSSSTTASSLVFLFRRASTTGSAWMSTASGTGRSNSNSDNGTAKSNSSSSPKGGMYEHLLSHHSASSSMSGNNAFREGGRARMSTADGKSTQLFDKLAFIGVGKMAAAIVDPLIKNGIQPADQVTLYDVSPNAMNSFTKAYPSIQVAQSIEEAVTDADCVVLAVKPQNIGEKFWSQFPQTVREDCTMLSILAGTPLRSLSGSGFPKIVRSMPNTPSTIGSGMTVWTCTPNLTTTERANISKLLTSIGKAIFVEDEKFVDMSTSLSGSGPAYIFLLMEAMIDAGVHMGFSRETATTLVHHTLLGSTLYAMETGEHPAILRNSVTSPAGTTASAIYALEAGQFRTTIKDAIWACYRRSLEMAGKDPAVGPGMRSAHFDTHVVHNHYNLPDGEMKWTVNDDEDDEDGGEKIVLTIDPTTSDEDIESTSTLPPKVINK
mmetsp:Transcript_58651/g.143431  ORF Transcript_58651/g.143431 Transcript_58651/m.143431 type:complete len:444 (+) Transcript_58651:197-1528(+)